MSLFTWAESFPEVLSQEKTFLKACGELEKFNFLPHLLLPAYFLTKPCNALVIWLFTTFRYIRG